MPYTMHVIFSDGYDLSTEFDSLVEGVQAITGNFEDNEHMRNLREVYIISNETGEIVYHVVTKLKIDIYNPYSL